MLELSKYLVFLLFFWLLIVALGTSSPDCVLCTKDTNDTCISSHCLNNTCKEGTKICLHGCIEGYFPSGSSCYLCSANCKTCANTSNNCIECKDGYYGSSCQYSCSRCKDSICTRDNCTYGCGDGFYRGEDACNSCNERCVRCSHYDHCQVCENEFFGPACQFECIDCSPCNQNGSCPSTTGLPLTSTTQPTSSSNESAITSFPTTSISTTTPSQASPSQDLTSSGVPPTNSTQPQTNTESNPENNTPIIYAAAGGSGGLVVIVLVIVVCKGRGGPKQSDTVVENMEMTENENYVSANDAISRNSTNTQDEITQNEQEDNDALYSIPNKMQRQTMVTMETESFEGADDSQFNITRKIPLNIKYSDLI